MKVRIGFVSNSSSSSYIIAVGKIINEKLAIEYLDKYGIDYDIRTVSELLNYGNKYMTRAAFDGNEVSIKIDANKPDDKYISIRHSEDMEESEDGDTNYDIDSDYFDKTGQAIFMINEECGISNFESTYGAGRDG